MPKLIFLSKMLIVYNSKVSECMLTCDSGKSVELWAGTEEVS